MKKKVLSFLLVLTICLGFLPVRAFATEADLPDWYFLFAIFKNVDADCKDESDVMQRVKYTMTQDEIDFIREDADDLEKYMNQVGVMRAHLEVVEIDAPITKLNNDSELKGFLSVKEAAPLLKDYVDLDRYDHITCVANFNISTGYWGVGGFFYENGSGHASINLTSREYFIDYIHGEKRDFPISVYVHEFLHFMENMNKKYGVEFNLHNVMNGSYKLENDIYEEECYTDIILNRAEGNAGTGVHPAVWQYSPRALRTIREMTLPSSVTDIADHAFREHATLTKVFIPSSVKTIGECAFYRCTSLAELTISPGVQTIESHAFRECAALSKVNIPPSVKMIGGCAFYDCAALNEVNIFSGVNTIGDHAFQNCATLTKLTISSGVKTIGECAFCGCTALTRVSIPASVTSIGYAAFYDTNVQDVYYGGTETQWKAIQTGEFNEKLTGVNIYYNHLMVDIKVDDWYAEPVAWALENNVTSGTGGGNFSPNADCTVAQILTFLWRADGSPKSTASNPFSDVNSGDYFYDAAVWAFEKGMVSGENFSGNTPCTRAVAATYLWKAAGSPPAKAANFTDVSVNANYAQAVNWALEQGVTSGTSATTFSPESVCTRGQIVTFLYRTLK